jgi:hypothetical protein
MCSQGSPLFWLVVSVVHCSAAVQPPDVIQSIHPPTTRLASTLAGHHVLDEAERSLHDALCVLSQTVLDSRVIYGGGWAEMQMARVVDDLAARTPGKKSLAMAAFGRALRQMPTIICDNAGLDAAEIVSQMRAAHAADPDTTAAGVDVVTGSVGDMQQVRLEGRPVGGAQPGGAPRCACIPAQAPIPSLLCAPPCRWASSRLSR